MPQFNALVFIDPTDEDIIISIKAETEEQRAALTDIKEVLADLQSRAAITGLLTVLVFKKDDQNSINLSIH